MNLSTIYKLLLLYTISNNWNKFVSSKVSEYREVERELDTDVCSPCEEEDESSDEGVTVSCSRKVRGKKVTCITKHTSNVGEDDENEVEELVVKGKKKVRGKKVRYQTSHTTVYEDAEDEDDETNFSVKNSNDKNGKSKPKKPKLRKNKKLSTLPKLSEPEDLKPSRTDDNVEPDQNESDRQEQSKELVKEEETEDKAEEENEEDSKPLNLIRVVEPSATEESECLKNHELTLYSSLFNPSFSSLYLANEPGYDESLNYQLPQKGDDDGTKTLDQSQDENQPILKDKETLSIHKQEDRSGTSVILSEDGSQLEKNGKWKQQEDSATPSHYKAQAFGSTTLQTSYSTKFGSFLSTFSSTLHSEKSPNLTTPGDSAPAVNNTTSGSQSTSALPFNLSQFDSAPKSQPKVEAQTFHLLYATPPAKGVLAEAFNQNENDQKSESQQSTDQSTPVTNPEKNSSLSSRITSQSQDCVQSTLVTSDQTPTSTDADATTTLPSQDCDKTTLTHTSESSNVTTAPDTSDSTDQSAVAPVEQEKEKDQEEQDQQGESTEVQDQSSEGDDQQTSESTSTTQKEHVTSSQEDKSGDDTTTSTAKEPEDEQDQQDEGTKEGDKSTVTSDQSSESTVETPDAGGTKTLDESSTVVTTTTDQTTDQVRSQVGGSITTTDEVTEDATGEEEDQSTQPVTSTPIKEEEEDKGGSQDGALAVVASSESVSPTISTQPVKAEKSESQSTTIKTPSESGEPKKVTETKEVESESPPASSTPVTMPTSVPPSDESSPKQVTLDITTTQGNNEFDYKEEAVFSRKYGIYTAKDNHYFTKIEVKDPSNGSTLDFWNLPVTESDTNLPNLVKTFKENNGDLYVLVLVQSCEKFVLLHKPNNGTWSDISSKRHNLTSVKMMDEDDKEIGDDKYELDLNGLAYGFILKENANCRSVKLDNNQMWHPINTGKGTDVYVTTLHLGLLSNKFLLTFTNKENKVVELIGNEFKSQSSSTLPENQTTQPGQSQSGSYSESKPHSPTGQYIQPSEAAQSHVSPTSEDSESGTTPLSSGETLTGGESGTEGPKEEQEGDQDIDQTPATSATVVESPNGVTGSGDDSGSFATGGSPDIDQSGVVGPGSKESSEGSEDGATTTPMTVVSEPQKTTTELVNLSPVELDLNSKKTNDNTNYSKSGKVHTYTPKGNYGFNLVKNKKEVVYETSNSSEYGHKVENDEDTKIVTLYLGGDEYKQFMNSDNKWTQLSDDIRPVELDVKKSPKQFIIDEVGKIKTFNPKLGFCINKAKYGDEIIWETTNASEYSDKVVYDKTNDKRKTVTIHLPNNKKKDFTYYEYLWRHKVKSKNEGEQDKLASPVNILNKISTVIRDCKIENRVHTFTSKAGFIFNSVLEGDSQSSSYNNVQTVIWKTEDENEYFDKVIYDQNEKTVKIYLPNNEEKEFKKSDGKWTETTENEDQEQSGDESEEDVEDHGPVLLLQPLEQTSPHPSKHESQNKPAGELGKGNEDPVDQSLKPKGSNDSEVRAADGSLSTDSNQQENQPTSSHLQPTESPNQTQSYKQLSDQSQSNVNKVALDISMSYSTSMFEFKGDNDMKTFKAKENYLFNEVKDSIIEVWRSTDDKCSGKVVVTDKGNGSKELEIELPDGNKQYYKESEYSLWKQGKLPTSTPASSTG